MSLCGTVLGSSVYHFAMSSDEKYELLSNCELLQANFFQSLLHPPTQVVCSAELHKQNICYLQALKLLINPATVLAPFTLLLVCGNVCQSTNTSI